MRKPFFISIICLMAAAFAVAVVSCKKENENTTQEAPTTEKVAADNMDEYLMAFKKKLLSAQKGDETLSIEAMPIMPLMKYNMTLCLCL